MSGFGSFETKHLARPPNVAKILVSRQRPRVVRPTLKHCLRPQQWRYCHRYGHNRLLVSVRPRYWPRGRTKRVSLIFHIALEVLPTKSRFGMTAEQSLYTYTYTYLPVVWVILVKYLASRRRQRYLLPVRLADTQGMR